jgi:hypothetical protein
VRAVLLIVCVAVASEAARAGDGVIEINQASASFPVNLVTGSYRLTGDLVVSTAVNAIVLNSSGSSTAGKGITLDLNGFTIEGSGLGLSGIRNLGGSNTVDVVVTNGTIRGFTEYGIFADGDRSRVERVRAIENDLTGIVVGSDASVIDSAAIDNGGNGIVFLTTVIIEGCTVGSNDGAGIVGQSGRVARNVVFGNALQGIVGAVLAESNAVRGNGGTGILSGSAVLGNAVTANVGIGLAGGPRHARNVINANTGGTVATVPAPVVMDRSACNGSGTCP